MINDFRRLRLLVLINSEALPGGLIVKHHYDVPRQQNYFTVKTIYTRRAYHGQRVHCVLTCRGTKHKDRANYLQDRSEKEIRLRKLTFQA